MLGLKSLGELPFTTLRTADQGVEADALTDILDTSDRDLIYLIEIDAFSLSQR